MGKISKLMKLLSASAVVAGANSVALADCGLCGDKTDDHKVSACPHFDYRGYGLSKGYKPETLPDNDFLGKLALADRKNADAFLNAPKSTTVTFLSDNSDSATAVSESDAGETEAAAEEMRRDDAARKITQALRENKERQVARREAESKRRAEIRAERLAERKRNQDRANYHAEVTRAEALQNLFDEENAHKAEAPYNRAKQERARARDSEELKEMVAASLAKNREDRREARELRAKDAHLQAHLRRREKEREQLSSMMKNSLSENREREDDERWAKALQLSEKREALENAREARRREAGAKQLRENNDAASTIANARRRQLARRKAAELKDEAERQGKIQEYRENAAARKLTEALRKNKERKQADRQAQIDGDYELAKKLQAEYDAEDRQIRADRLLAEQEQLRENLAAVPVEEARNGEDFEYRSERDQINADNLLAQQEQAREYLGMNTQDQSRTTAIKEAGVADEEVETDRWTLPQATAWNFQGFDFEDNRRSADRWARQLDDLSIRKIECIMWLISTSFQQLQNGGNFAPTAPMAEAISDVNSIFPYSGTNSGIMNVYNAFENTDTADFMRDVERLSMSKLCGVLWYVSNRYMHLLLPGNGKKAASAKFIELAKATLEHFDTVWEADEAEIVPDSEDLREAPRDPVNFKANDGEITETEPQETERWNPPYRVYYAYCLDIKDGLRPSSGSRRVKQNPDLFREDLRSRNIRRFEVLIYLANGIYKDGLKNGALPLSNELAKFVEDVDNVFPKVGEGEPNARVMNVYNALKNLLDKPNDNPISMQPFQKGFRELTSNEKVLALGDMAVAYREKLREGHRPASMAFVNWANEICKELNLDGYRNGQDNVHPELKFEEFENKAEKPTVASDAAGNPAVVAENHQEPADVGAREPESDWEPTEWKLPEDVYNSLEFRYEGYYSNPDRETSNEGQARERLQKQIGALNVRQLEALLGLASSAYTQELEEGHGARPISNKIAQQAKDIFQLIVRARHGENEHLLNVLETVNKADGRGDFQRDVMRLPARQIEALIAMIAEVYDDKVDEGAVPAAPEFKKFSHDILKLMYLKYYDEEETPAEDEATNDSRRNALEGDNGVLIDPARA